MLKFETAKRLHSYFVFDEPESRIECANALMHALGIKDRKCTNLATANDILLATLLFELENERYLTGATLCWGTELFDSRPKSVQLIWNGLQKHPQLLIFGSAALGKSYSAICYCLLDWSRDPEFTTTKLVSTTAGHERANTFSNLVRLHRFSAIPLPGYIKQGFIGLDKDDKRSSISEVTIDKGDENKSAKLQGFHPLPRPYPHPKFGWLTRVRGIFDEAEDIAVGLWKGEANMMVNMDDQMHVSIVAMWNPKDRQSMAARKAEPQKGWANLDERLDEYTSKEGYHTIRLDARKCENIVQNKIIFPGLITPQGFRKLEERGGADFVTFGQGLYPVETGAFGIISPISLEQRRGKFIWERRPTPMGTLDMAEEGRDQAIFTESLYGRAVGFEPEGLKPKMFDTPRWAIQVEQQFPLLKQNTIRMGAEFIRMCRLLRIVPEWSAIDCTNSVTLRDWLRLKWGDVLGIKWGEGATELPILEESGEKASDLYVNVKTEMWFATGAWVEFGYMAFAPHMDTSQLFNELSGMRYKPVSKTMKRCEETKEFKKRFGGISPDFAASCVMTTHLVRQRSHLIREMGQRPALDPANRQIIEPDQISEVGSIHSDDSEEAIDAIRYL